MSNISIEHGDRLYWLGRYAERFFTTMKSLERLHDKVIDRDSEHYKKYLECFGLPDTYGDSKNFFESFILDKNNTCSVAYSLERAYDNGIVLREEISTEALAYLQLAMDKLYGLKGNSLKGLAVTLLPLQDIMFSFWGCIMDNVHSEEIRNIIFCGKYVERLELYIRLKYRYQLILREFERLCTVLNRIPENTPYRFNEKQLSVMEEIIRDSERYSDSRNEVLSALAKLFEPSKRKDLVT
ncbi:MAG: alpha-E domain-containing protein [Oscillospiraceae bacterium]|nr:alpha-E domain-containing protein [Oscillospiraceae bacterium]